MLGAVRRRSRDCRVPLSAEATSAKRTKMRVTSSSMAPGYTFTTQRTTRPKREHSEEVSDSSCGSKLPAPAMFCQGVNACRDYYVAYEKEEDRSGEL